MEKQTLPLAVGCLWAFVLGTVGFVAGYFGPIYISENSPQGPLVGIFMTGPLGFLFGLLTGTSIGTVPATSDPYAVRLLCIVTAVYAVVIVCYTAIMS
ncbi:MAG: hypothetical protein R3C45_01550 [Phycisphaerales bacterium]